MFLPPFPFYLYVFGDHDFLKTTNDGILSEKWEQCVKSLEAQSPGTKYFMSTWSLEDH